MIEEGSQSHRFATDTLGETIDHIRGNLEQYDQDLRNMELYSAEAKIDEKEFQAFRQENRRGRDVRKAQLDAILDETERGGFNPSTRYIDFLEAINDPSYIKQTS